VVITHLHFEKFTLRTGSYYPGPNNTPPVPVGTPPPYPLTPGPGFGQLKDLIAASYDWYAPAGQTEAPLMRLLLSNGPYTGNMPPNHVATLAYLPHSEAGFVNNTWTTANMLAGLNVMKTSGDPAYCGAIGATRSFTDYATDPLLNCRDLYVFAVEIGFGSGAPANFDGAADNVKVTGSFTPPTGIVQRIVLDDTFGVMAWAGGGGANSVPALGWGGLLGLSAVLAGAGALRARRRRRTG